MTGPRTYGWTRLGRYGLAHGILAWARCVVWCEQTGAAMIAPFWFKPRIGPWLRRERDRRTYFKLFHAGRAIGGLRRLALLATRTTPKRRPAAAALTWIMMIFGIVVTAGIAGSLLDPFSPQRLALVAGGVSLAAFVLTLAAVAGIEGTGDPSAAEQPSSEAPAQSPAFAVVIREIWADPAARRFTVFVFVASQGRRRRPRSAGQGLQPSQGSRTPPISACGRDRRR